MQKAQTPTALPLLALPIQRDDKGGVGQPLAAQLSHIEQAGLIQRAEPEPDLAYRFKHALTQESAYRSFLHRAVREVHRRVAETYESLYPDQLDEYAALLAAHYAEAGDESKTLVFSRRAAERASRVHANPEAFIHLSRALEMAQRTSADASTVQDIFTRRGRVLELMGRYADAEENYEAMEKWARRHRHPSMELASLIPRAIMHAIPTAQIDFPRAQVFIERALALAERLDDHAAQARVYWSRMLLNNFSGHFEQAIADGEKSIALARQFDLREQLAYSLNDITRAMYSSGAFEAAPAYLAEAQALWRELGNQPMLADSLSTAALGLVLTGHPREGVALAREANEISRSIGNAWGISFSAEVLANTYLELGLLTESLAAAEEAIAFGEQAGFLDPQVNGRALLALSLAQFGALERGEQIIAEALKCAKGEGGEGESAPRVVLAYLQILRGDYDLAEKALASISQQTGGENSPYYYVFAYTHLELALARREYDRVIQLVDQTAELLARFHYGVHEVLSFKARALAAMGHSEEAIALLERVATMAEETGTRRRLWTIYAELYKLEDKRGNTVSAQRWRERAREEIQFLADRCPDDVRVTFLELPAVREMT